MMSLGVFLWVGAIVVAFLVIARLSWYSLQHIRRATDAERSYRSECRRVLAHYTTMRFRRIDDPRYLSDARATGMTRRH